jgi:hypothetical protein
MQRAMGLGIILAGAAAIFAQPAAFGATEASATISSQQLSSNSWKYSMDLTNTGDTTINTFWAGWIVYADLYVYDLLPTLPSNVSSPTGWGGGAVNDGALYSPGYYGIEWQSATGLAPGQKLSGFTFTTSDSPAIVEGDAASFPGYLADESWVYHGASQSEPGFELTPTIVVPEPASAMLLIPAGIILASRRRRGQMR